jgi:hypothetical protein
MTSVFVVQSDHQGELDGVFATQELAEAYILAHLPPGSGPVQLSECEVVSGQEEPRRYDLPDPRRKVKP